MTEEDSPIPGPKEEASPPLPPSVVANKLGARSLWSAISIGDDDAVQKIVDSGGQQRQAMAMTEA